MFLSGAIRMRRAAGELAPRFRFRCSPPSGCGGAVGRRSSSFFAESLRENVVRSAVAQVDLPTVEGGDDYVFDIDTRLGPTGRLDEARQAGLVDPFRLVQKDMEILNGGCQSLLGTDHPVLSAAAKYFFELDAGKKVRPTMVLLMSGCLNHHAATRESREVTEVQIERQRRLAEITEMIHTASLFHDDVIDKADTRRGVPSANKAFGNKMAILAGDFLLARASVGLARLRSLATVELLSTVIEHLVKGEILQMKPLASEKGFDGAFEHYVRKNYYKTGSLMSNSCRAAAILGDHSQDLEEAAYSYGKRIGLAFQLIDDVLDFEGNELTLGKPALNDIRQGLATAPILLAGEVFPDEISALVERKFSGPGDVDETLSFVQASGSLKRTRDIAVAQAELAMEAIQKLEPSPERDALVALAARIVDRSF